MVLALVCFILPRSTLGFEKSTFLTVSHPIRGREDWPSIKQDPLDLPRFQYHEATMSGTPVTWLLRFDAVTDATISGFFKQVIDTRSDHDLGAFLEITPSLARLANVPYPDGISIFDANRVFLSGYTQADRLKLIDTYMAVFKDRFGFFPKSVGAWHIDAYSLEYLREKYTVITALICDDQYSTDGYRLWGGYLGSPYLPSKSNVLVPAISKEDRIDIVVVRWAQRDLYNFYGGSWANSIHSVQINDYLATGENTAYFEGLLDQYSQKDFNEFSHINLGLENDYLLKSYGSEINNVSAVIKKRLESGQLKAVTLAQLGNFVLTFYPESAPIYLYSAQDPTKNSEGSVIWYQSPSYRIGLKNTASQTRIIDLRAYNPAVYEDHYTTYNTSRHLYLEIPPAIDSVKSPGTEVTLDISLEKAEVEYQYRRAKYTYEGKTIEFTPTSIIFSGFTPPEAPKDIRVTKTASGVVWTFSPITPLRPQFNHLLLLFAIFIPLIFIAVMFNKPLALGLFFALITTATVIRSGDLFPFGLGIWGPNGHDAIFHLSLINSFSQKPLDFSHPQLSGEKLSNYHFLFDFIGGVVCKVTGISPVTFYFLLFPILTSIALCFLLSKLLDLWKYSSIQKSLSFFLVFLSGSLGFIPSLIKGGSLFGGESAFWANQSVSWLLNPPFALSLVLLVLFLILLENKRNNPVRLIFLALIGGLLVQAKIYSFILLVGALFFSGQLIPAVSVGLVGVVLLLPFTKFGSSPFVFQPLWFSESLFASPDRVWWPKLAQAWQTYQSEGNFPKLIAVNLFAVIVFLLGNLGVRIMGFLRVLRGGILQRSEKTALWIAVFGIIIPLLFIQKVNPWNTIQFIYYSIFFLSLFVAKEIASIIQRSTSFSKKVVIILLVVLFSLPTTIGTLKDYFTRNSSSRISYTEAKALEFLQSQPKGLVLTAVYTPQNSRLTPEPRSLYGYISTAYISAISGQKEYLSDTINLDITGYNYNERVKDILRLQNTQDREWGKAFLKSADITYVYQTPFMKFTLTPDQFCLEKIFDSGEINIYKFNCHE